MASIFTNLSLPRQNSFLDAVAAISVLSIHDGSEIQGGFHDMKLKSQVAASSNDMAFSTQPKVTRFHCVRWKSYVPH